MTLAFYKQSEDFLVKISDLIEKEDVDSIFDVDCSDGILTILVHTSDEEYIINRHSANQKIWYSSPLSGADYFTFDESSRQWINAKGVELRDKLFAELKTFK